MIRARDHQVAGPCRCRGGQAPAVTDRDRAVLLPVHQEERHVLEPCLEDLKPVTRYNGQQKGYSLALSWKNGTTKTIDALNTGVKAITLVLADGNSLTSENDQDLKYKALPQAAGTTLQLSFWADSAQSAAGLGQPSKLLVDTFTVSIVSAGATYMTWFGSQMLTLVAPSVRVELFVFAWPLTFVVMERAGVSVSALPKDIGIVPGTRFINA